MKITFQLFCIGSILAVLNACTITKRHSMPGYHVEWKKNWKETDRSTAKTGTAVPDTLNARTAMVSKTGTSSEIHSVHGILPGSETKSDTPVMHESVAADRVYSQDEINREERVSEREEANKEEVKDASVPEVKKKVEPLTWVALAFFLAGVGFGLLPASLFSSLTLPLILLALLLFVAFVNAVSSASRVKRNPEKYKGKEFTWIMVFLCSLGFAAALVFLLSNFLFPA